MKSNWILLLGIVASFTISVEGLRLVNNGYNDLYIVIQETVSENVDFLDRIQKIFKDASVLLYKATQKRAYFENLTLIVPKTWTKSNVDMTVPALSTFTSHIRIGNNSLKTPTTFGSEECGKEGLYTYLDADVLKNDTTKWGSHSSVIVHEWGHLRWGLKNEYPSIRRGSQSTWRFYQAHGRWNPVGCTRNIEGYANTTCNPSKHDGNPDGKFDGNLDEKCNLTQVFNMIGSECTFCPTMEQPLKASVMAFQYIPSISEFCDKDDHNTQKHLRHNSEAPNEQNMYCNGKSAWEVMREHKDFKNDNPALNDDLPKSTNFVIARETDKVRVLVLDTSGSMSGTKIETLYLTSVLMIERYLQTGSWLTIIDFDSDAKNMTDFVKIDTNFTRNLLISKLPTEADGGTCIPCGTDLALTMLISFEEIDSTRESEIILISDGANGDGDMEEATVRLVDAGVVVHSIAVTEAADQRLVDISRRTGGRCFAYTEGGSVSLAALLSEIIFGGSAAGSYAATMVSEELLLTKEVPIVINFNIDDSIGKDTSISVLSRYNSNVEVELFGPDNFTRMESYNSVKSLTLFISGVIKPGKYMVEITSSTSHSVEVIVTSKPVSTDFETIRPTVRLSTHQLDFSDTDSIPVLYAYLRKGESPILHANVTAVVNGPRGTITCDLNLLDNGLSPDIQPNDGIYSGYVHRGCQRGNGRYNSKVIFSGNKDTVVTLYSSSGSAVIDDDETSSPEEVATGIFERIAVPEAFTVTNYDSVAASRDITPPGRITDLEVIDLHTGMSSKDLSRNYTITWTATGDDLNIGQATTYEMKISTNLTSLRNNFSLADTFNASGDSMSPATAGRVERLMMIVSTDDTVTSTAYFAIAAVDEVGNRGPVSNIIPITVGITNIFEVIQEECTDDCYAVVTDCGRSFAIENGHVDFTGSATTPGNNVPVSCNMGYKLIGGNSIECLANGTWTDFVRCRIRALGETCRIDKDCSQISNSTCAKGSEDDDFRCACLFGYHGVSGDTLCRTVDEVREQVLRSNSISAQTLIGICAAGIVLFGLGLTACIIVRRRRMQKARKYGVQDVQQNFKVVCSSDSAMEIYSTNHIY